MAIHLVLTKKTCHSKTAVAPDAQHIMWPVRSGLNMIPMLYNLSNPYDCQRFKEQTNAMVKAQDYVELKRKHTNRSLAQNSYLHLLLGYFASEFGYTLEEVKQDIFKKHCNIDIFKGRRRNKRGNVVEYIRSTTELDKEEMTRAIERFRNYSSAQCGLYLPQPNEHENIFFAQQQIESYKEYM